MQQKEKNDNKIQVSKIYFIFVSSFFFVAYMLLKKVEI